MRKDDVGLERGEGDGGSARGGGFAEASSGGYTYLRREFVIALSLLCCCRTGREGDFMAGDSALGGSEIV